MTTLPTNTAFPVDPRLVQDGEPLSAGVANRAVQVTNARVALLRELLEALESGQLLITTVPVSPALVVGTPVYLDDQGTAQPALATRMGADVMAMPGVQAHCFGVIIDRPTNATAAVVTMGRTVQLSGAQWAQVMPDDLVAGQPVPGHYYLSTATPGIMTRSPGGLAVYVGQLLADMSFVVRVPGPQRGEHLHVYFDLTYAPAGTPNYPDFGNPHTITGASTAQRGWLPATSAFFDSAIIPLGAKFGYNLRHPDDADLAAAWPPIPIEGASLSQSGLTIGNDDVLIDVNGIWWMSDAYGNVPWPIQEVSGQDLRLWMTRLMFATDPSAVTSLSSHADSLLDLDFVDSKGVTAQQGRLRAIVRSLLSASLTGQMPGISVKSITGKTFVTGPSVDALVAGAGISLTQDQQHPGRWTVASSTSAALSGTADVLNLANAQQGFVQDIPVVLLPKGRTSSPVWSIKVSPQAGVTNRMNLDLWLYSSITGQIPSGAVTLSYRIVPAGTSTSQAIPTGWTSLATLDGLSIVANQYTKLSLAPIPGVPAGALVLIRVARAGAVDGLAGDLGFLNFGYQLS